MTYNKSLDIRLAELNDLGDILDILDKAAIWMFEKGITNQWIPGEVFKYDHYYKDAIEQGHLYVATSHEQAVGTVLIRWSDDDIWDDGCKSSGYIHHLAVDRCTSIQELGHKILAWSESKIIESDKSKVRLDCIESNTRLNEYYLERGYNFVKTFEYYDGDKGNLYEKSVLKA